MRDFMGNHVSQVDARGTAVDGDGIHVLTTTLGSFQVHYAAHIDRICVDVVGGGTYHGRTTMQLTLDQAMLLRTLLDAGIADAIAATTVETVTATKEVAS